MTDPDYTGSESADPPQLAAPARPRAEASISIPLELLRPVLVAETVEELLCDMLDHGVALTDVSISLGYGPTEGVHTVRAWAR